jgi:two-component sensor histidine kinase/ABC-type amino acid transport substrate-binding protein
MGRYCLWILIIAFHSWNKLHGQQYNIKYTQEEKQWIAEHPIIYFGYEPNWPPYEIYTEGSYQGIVGEYVKILERETGIRLIPHGDMSWEKAIKGLEDGTIRMVPSCAITPSRKKYLEFTDVYIDDPIVIVTRRDYPKVIDLSSLNGAKVVLPKSYYTAELIEGEYADIEIIFRESIEACLASLTFEEADAFVGNLGVVNYYIHNHGFTNLRIAAPTYFKQSGIALAVVKEWKVFRDIAQKVFNRISPSEKAHIREKWLGYEAQESFNWSKFTTYAVVVILIGLVIIAVLYYWNNVLRDTIQKRKRIESELRDSLVALKRQDNEKKVLLQEIHHRVKNNLQIVSSMIRLQANMTKNEQAVETLREAVERVSTIALVHEKIYNTPNLDKVCLSEYSIDLVQEIISNYSGDKHPEFQKPEKKICIGLDYIVPFALILNELVTNTLKYAFSKQNRPEIGLSFKVEEGNLVFHYWDNGTWKQNEQTDLFGTSLIDIFTEQLNGEYSLNKASNGTYYTFRFAIKVEVNFDKN